MKRKIFNIAVLFSFILMTISSCSENKSPADCAYYFVVWDDYIYQVSDDYVNEINEEIGEVTKYSDLEGTYTGNFSNKYNKGTKYYSIKGINVEEAIAIKDDGKFRKAIRDGKYREK